MDVKKLNVRREFRTHSTFPVFIPHDGIQVQSRVRNCGLRGKEVSEIWRCSWLKEITSQRGHKSLQSFISKGLLACKLVKAHGRFRYWGRVKETRGMNWKGGEGLKGIKGEGEIISPGSSQWYVQGAPVHPGFMGVLFTDKSPHLGD